MKTLKQIAEVVLIVVGVVILFVLPFCWLPAQ